MSKSQQQTIIFTLFIAFFILVFYGLNTARLPLVLAFLVAYLTFPVILKLERWGIHRLLASSIAFILLGVFNLAIILFFGPKLIQQVAGLAHEFPEYLFQALHKLQTLSEDLGFPLPAIDKEQLTVLIQKNSELFSMDALKGISSFLQSSLVNILSAILTLLNFLLMPVFFFFVIHQFEDLKKFAKSLIPQTWSTFGDTLLSRIGTILTGYIRGQLLVALTLGLLYGIGLSLVQLRFGFLIGLISGILSLIPYAGFVIGITTSLVVAMTTENSNWIYLAVILVFGLVQTLDSLLVTPRLVGNKVGLTALETMLSLIVMGNLFGFGGMLVAIPTGATAKQLLASMYSHYQKVNHS